MSAATKIKFAEKLAQLIKDKPNSDKVEIWKKQLEATLRNAESKKTGQRKKRPYNKNKNKKMSLNKPKRERVVKAAKNLKARVNNTSPVSNELEETLAINIAETLAGMLNPDSGPIRYPDSVDQPTATYKSIVQFPVFADTTENGGRFTVIVQPILGSTHATSAYKIGYVNCSTVNPDLVNPNSFIYNELIQDLRIDPNIDVLLSGTDIDVSYNFTSPSNSSLQPLDQMTLADEAGVHYEGFSVNSVATHDAINFTPDYTLIIVPVGQFAMSWISAPTVTSVQWNTSSNYQKVQTTLASSGNTLGKISLNAFWLPDNASAMPTELIDQFELGWTGDSGGVGTPTGPTVSNGSVFVLQTNAAIAGSVTGAGANTGSDLGPFLNFNLSLNIPQRDGYSVAIGCYLQTPVMANAYDAGFLTNVRFTSTEILGVSPYYDNSGLVQRIRPTAMKAHLAFTAPDAYIGGTIASTIYPGSFQKRVFSPAGFSLTSYQSVSTAERTNKRYQGPLKMGTYVTWAPEVFSDYQPKDYNTTLDYEYPFIVITGNVASSNGAWQGEIGTLRVVVTYEYFTTSTVVETKTSFGANNYMEAVLAALSRQNLCTENPKHIDFFKNVLNSASKVVSTIAKITPQISSVINTVGAAIL